jgi:hypothetical protein
MILSETGRMLDESKSGPCDPYNLEMTAWMMFWMPPLSDAIRPTPCRVVQSVCCIARSAFLAASRVPSFSPPIVFDILCDGYLAIVGSFLGFDLTYLNECD